MALNDRKRVLVLFGESLAAPESCYSLLDAGFAVEVVCRRDLRSGLRRSRFLRCHDVTHPETDHESCVSEISKISNELKIQAILPLDDVSLWLLDRNRSLFDIPLAISSEHAVGVALDKRQQIEIAAESGFDVPMSALANDEAAVSRWSSFPCILKGALAARPVGSGLGRGSAFYCDSPDSLTASVKLETPDDPMILQEWHRGRGIGVFGFRTEEGVKAWSGHRRVRMMNPAGSGSSCCESFSPNPEIRKSVERFLELADWKGLFMVELLRDEHGRDWFMELNGRTWGSMALARAGGMEYPAWSVLDALGELPTLPSEIDTNHRRGRHLGREIVHLLLVLRGAGRNVGMHWPGRVSTIRDLCSLRRSDRWYNFKRGDTGVFWSDTASCVAGQILKRKRS